MLITIKQLEVRNFVTHRQETVVFPRTGIVLLWGPSGAGKTSLISEGVGFSLFGLAGTRAQSLTDLRNDQFPEEDWGVRLTLDLGEEQEVQIFRGTEDGKSVVWLADTDGEFIEGAKPVEKRIRELIGGMDGATFFNTYFSPQGELDQLVRKAGGERRKFIQRMLGISLLDKVTTEVNRHLTQASDRVKLHDEQMPSATEPELQQAAADTKHTHEQAVALRDKLTGDVTAAQAIADSLEERASALEERARVAQQARLTVDDLTEQRIPGYVQQLTDTRSALADAEQAAARLADDVDLGETISSLRAELGTLRDAQQAADVLEALTAEADTAKQHLDRTAEQLVAHPAPDSSQAAEDFEKLKVGREKLKARYEMLTTKLTELRGQHEKLTADGICFTCHRELDDPNVALGGLHEQISAVEIQLKDVVAEGKNVRAQLEAAQQAAQAAQQAEQAHREALHAHSQADETYRTAHARAQKAQQAAEGADVGRLSEVRSELDRLSEQAARLDADRKLAATQPDLTSRASQLDAALTAAQEKVIELTGQIDDLPDPAEWETAREKAKSARGHHADLREQAAQAAGAAQQADRDHADAVNDLERYRNVKDERDKQDAKRQALARLHQSFKDFKIEMVSQIRPGLEVRTSEHLHALTEGRMPAVKISDEYDLAVSKGGNWRRASLLSGGEKARAAFSLRLALTEMVAQRTDTPIGFLAFDEIFGSQDPDHREAILGCLQHVRGHWPQTFLISHEESIRDHHAITTLVEIPDADSPNRIKVTQR